MKSYEELLSDIEEDMELMGSSHIVYSMEEDGIVTDYDYLPSDSCTISITLKELQEKLQLQMLYAKVSSHTAGADKNAPKLAVVFPGIGYTADKPLLYYTGRLASKHGYQIRTVSYDNLPENVKGDPEKMKQAFDLALEQTERALSSIDWNSYGSVLFISKSRRRLESPQSRSSSISRRPDLPSTVFQARAQGVHGRYGATQCTQVRELQVL